MYYPDCQRTSKSLSAHPCNHPFAAKHLLFNNPRLLFYIDFITLRQSPLTIPEKKNSNKWIIVPCLFLIDQELKSNKLTNIKGFFFKTPLNHLKSIKTIIH
jgi:hypothetical protein